jgi:hypothetical protein
VPAGDDWQHEIKFDGFRVQIHKSGRDVVLFSRSQRFGKRYPQMADAFRGLPAKSAIIDGELVASDSSGMPDFWRLFLRSPERPSSAYGHSIFWSTTASDYLICDVSASELRRRGYASTPNRVAAVPARRAPRSSAGRPRPGESASPMCVLGRGSLSPRWNCSDRARAASRLSLRRGEDLSQGNLRALPISVCRSW